MGFKCLSAAAFNALEIYGQLNINILMALLIIL